MINAKTLVLIPLATALLIAGCKPAEPAPSAEAKPPARKEKKAPIERIALLPETTHSYIHLSNTEKCIEQLKKSSVSKLWADRQFQNFMGNPDAEVGLELLFKGSSKAESHMMLEQLKMLKGELIFSISTTSAKPYIIAAMPHAEFLHSLELDTKLNELADQPFEVLRHTFQGTEIIQHIEDAGTPKESSSWQAHLNGTLILGHTKEWVERSIVQLKKHSIREPAEAPSLTLNLDLAHLLHNPLRNTIRTSPVGMMTNPDKVLGALGLLGIEHLTSTIEVLDDQMIIDNVLSISDLTRGLFALVDTQPATWPTASFIPNQLAALQVGRLNLLNLWQEIPEALQQTAPALKPILDLQIDQLQQQTGVDIEQQLLAHMDSSYFSFSRTESNQQVSLTAFELNNPQAFRTALETALSTPILEQLTGGIDMQDFLDHTLFVQMLAHPDEAIAFAVIDNHICYGPVLSVRQAIRTASSGTHSLYQNSELIKGLRKQLPPTACGFSAVDWKKNIQLLSQEFTKPEYVQVIQQRWAMSGSALPPPDFRKLPAAEHLASFFNTAYQYLEPQPGGLHQRIILNY